MVNSITYFDGYLPALDAKRRLEADGGALRIEVVAGDRLNKAAMGENKFLAYALFYYEPKPDGLTFDVAGSRSTVMRTAMTANAILKFYNKVDPDQMRVSIPFLHERNLIYPRGEARPIHKQSDR